MDFECDPILWQAIVAFVGIEKAKEILKHAKDIREWEELLRENSNVDKA